MSTHSGRPIIFGQYVEILLDLTAILVFFNHYSVRNVKISGFCLWCPFPLKKNVMSQDVSFQQLAQGHFAGNIASVWIQPPY